MIRATRIGGTSCCTYVFWLSCMPVGGMGFWTIEYEVANEASAPVFTFGLTQDRAATSTVGFIPFQIDGHPGFSDEEETTVGYACSDGTPAGATDEGANWGESAFIDITSVGDGFSSVVITCIPYDPNTETMGDPITIDITADILCFIDGVSAGTTNWFTAGSGYPHPISGGCPTDTVGTTIYGGIDVVHCMGEGGYLTTAITEATVISGHVDYADGTSCDAGCCISDLSGCSPTIDSGNVSGTFDISTPVMMTQDPDNPGVWLADTSALGLGSSGTFSYLVAVLQIQTNLGVADWVIAHSSCF